MRTTGCFAILTKELIHMARDPVTIVFAMFPPIVQVIAFGFAIDTDVRNLRTVIFNEDRRSESWELIDAFRNTGVYHITHYVNSRRELTQTLVEGRAVVGIEIPPDFTDRRRREERASVGVYIDGSNNTIALQAMSTANMLGLNAIMQRLQEMTGDESHVSPLDIRPRIMFNPDLISANFFVPGIVGVALQLTLTMLVAFAIVREREAGTLEQLMVSPATRFGLLVGKVIPYLFLAYIQVSLLVLIMRFVFQIEIRGSLVLLLLLSGSFVLTVIGIGLFISTAAKNQMQATQMAIGLMLPSIFFSGFIYPRETMPTFFYTLSFVLPLTYFLEILRGIILRGAEWSNLVRQFIPLTSIGVVVFFASMLKFHKRLD